MSWRKGKFATVAFLLQAALLVLFIMLVRYKDSANASYKINSRDPGKGGADPAKNDVTFYYPMFQDVHVMMFIGFGFLMTFLKRYGYASVSINFLIASFVIQWATVMGGFFHLEEGKIFINIEKLLFADFAAAAVLISFGACLGKASPVQMLVMALLEIAVFQTNEWIGITYFRAVDVGGSMFVHVFGAYFGMAVAKVINDKDLYKSPAKDKEGSQYHSDIFSMIGTIFLWLFWPSFNSAIASPGDDQHRAVLNTYYSLAACTVMTFILSSLFDKKDKFDMVHIQNSTLAGGVAVGTMADMMIEPWGAIVVGMAAATISVIGFRFIHPFLTEKIHLHDTCGVNNLHGLPGIMAGVGGVVMAYLADESKYGLSLYQLFPARAPVDNSTALLNIQANFSAIEAGDGWSAGRQAAMQAAALGTSIGMAIVGGIITGLVLRIPIWNQPKNDDIFEDEPYFTLPEEGLPHVFMDGNMLPNKGETLSVIQTNGVEVTIKDATTKI